MDRRKRRGKWASEQEVNVREDKRKKAWRNTGEDVSQDAKDKDEEKKQARVGENEGNGHRARL